MAPKRVAAEIVVGTQLRSVTVTLQENWVRDYRAAVEDRTSWYDEAFATPIAPPAMLSLLSGKPLDATYEPVPGGIHAAQEFEFLRPMAVGETVTVSGQVVDKFERRGRTYVVVETYYHDAAGNLLARGRSASIVPETAPEE